MSRFDAAVVLVTYNPESNKLMDTIHSILIQKDIDLQLILADDGSKNCDFEQLEQYLNNIICFQKVVSPVNQGTVKNILNALQYVEAPYVKVISPGDSFLDEYVLKNWISFLKKSKKRWSFSDCTYFCYSDKWEKELLSVVAKPQAVQLYSVNDDKKNKELYLLAEDIAIGAAIISETDLLKDYLRRIENVVIYCEDVVYRMMMCEDEIGVFYPKSTIYYEYGLGISTSSSARWDRIIRKEWAQADKILLNSNLKLSFSTKMSLKVNCCENDFIRRVGRIIFQRRLLGKVLKERINPRLSNDFMTKNVYLQDEN